MRKRTLFYFLITLLPFIAFGQFKTTVPVSGDNPEGIIRCATVEIDEMKQAENPNMESRDDFERWLQEKMAEGSTLSRQLITIPVIVHIIHNGEVPGMGTNISQAQVESQIDVLNEDFRKMMGTPGYNTDPVGADSEIEFCLAGFDPAGAQLAEPGIDRVDRTTMGFNTPPFNSTYVDNTIKPATFWDPNQYLNIWVLNIGGGILGYAQFPSSSTLPGMPSNGGAANTDGVVIVYNSFGRIGNVSPPYNGGRTATHEIGHWLGLRHISGDGPCGTDDFCGDTPESDTQNYGCPTNHSSCGTIDMIQNYMDYTNDNCMNIFTLCQKTRMETVMANSPRRVQLLSSMACVQITAAPTAAFSWDTLVSCGGEIQFSDESLDFPTSWFWDFGNGQISTVKNPVATFAASGTYSVTLVANNFLGSSSSTQTIQITVLQAPDVDAGADQLVCSGQQIQLTATTDLPGMFSWSPSIDLSATNIFNPVVTVNATRIYYVSVTTPEGCVGRDTILISALPVPSVWAGLDKTINPGDTAQMGALGALTYEWTPTLGLNNPNIASPKASPPQTVTYTVRGYNNEGCWKEDDVLVKVNGTFHVGVDEAFQNNGTVYAPYPNPAMGSIMFSAELRTAGELKISLYDMTGRRVSRVFAGNTATGTFSYEWERGNSFGPGIYLAVWEMNGARFTQKVQLL